MQFEKVTDYEDSGDTEEVRSIEEKVIAKLRRETLVKYSPKMDTINQSLDTDGLDTKRQSVDVKKRKRRSELVTDQPVLLQPKTLPVILNKIFPIHILKDGSRCVISTQPDTARDAVQLQETLDARLVKNGAKHVGLCYIRRELYSQAFDEIIRQVTTNCAERGILLARIRNDIQQTLVHIERLHVSATVYGVQKHLGAESIMQKLKQQESSLNLRKLQLSKEIYELNQEIITKETEAKVELQGLKEAHRSKLCKLKKKVEVRKRSMWEILFPKEDYNLRFNDDSNEEKSTQDQ